MEEEEGRRERERKGKRTASGGPLNMQGKLAKVSRDCQAFWRRRG